jgi:hypothetical protein
MCSSTLSLTLALERDGWSTPRPGQFTPRKRPGTDCIGGWVGPQPFWTGEKNLDPPGFDTRTVQAFQCNYKTSH